MPSPGAQRGDIDIGRGGIRGDIERDDLSAQIGDEDDFSEDIADSLGLGTVSDQDIAAALGGIASGRFDRDWGRSRTDQGIASGNRPGSGYGNDWGRSRTDQGIAGGRLGYDDYDASAGGGLLDSDFQSDFATPGINTEGGWTVQGTLDQQRRANEAAAAGLDPVNQEGRLDRWGNAINRFFGMPQDVISQIDTFTEIDPTTGNVHHSDGRITDGTTGQTIQEPTRDWNEPWYMDPNRDRDNIAEDRDDSASEYACEAAGGTWDGGSCVMPSEDDDDDDNGEETEFGDADPFASLKRLEWTHPMLGYGQDAYSGTRPDYVSESIWDYKPPQLTDWTQRLKTWGGV